MKWRQDITEKLAEILRFTIRGALLVNGILAALFSIWFVGNLLWFTLRWLNRTLFKSPW